MEVIVVDDGSTDGTGAVLESFADTRLKVVRERHGGVSAARNVGFKHSRGRFILFFDADDVAVVENWGSILAELAARPDAVLVFGARRVFEGDADNFPRTPSDETYPPSDEMVPQIFMRNFINPGAVFIRREAFETAGLWNESLSQGEDWEMWCRLACVGRLVHCPVLVIGYRRHGQSATGTTVSRDAHDPCLAAIDAIYSHPLVRLRTGVHHHKLKKRALAWRAYYWGTTLIRSGAVWRGLKVLSWSFSRDPSRLLFMFSYPKRFLRRRMHQIKSTHAVWRRSDWHRVR
jgi:glycosyltransferase involved in cell wall biosynthesis